MDKDGGRLCIKYFDNDAGREGSRNAVEKAKNRKVTYEEQLYEFKAMQIPGTVSS